MTTARHAATKTTATVRPNHRLYAVDTKGVAEATTKAQTARWGVAGFIGKLAERIEAQNQTHWLVSLFESDQERRDRQSALLAAELMHAAQRLLSR